WTSAGVITAVALIAITDWYLFDPIIAIVVALNILREGYNVLKQSMSQLLDERLPEADETQIKKILEQQSDVLGVSNLRTRRAGVGRFAEVDIHVAASLNVAEAAQVAQAAESAVMSALADMEITVRAQPFFSTSDAT